MHECVTLFSCLFNIVKTIYLINKKTSSLRVASNFTYQRNAESDYTNLFTSRNSAKGPMLGEKKTAAGTSS